MGSGNTCGSGQQPMRLCTANGSDAEGNSCNWRNCGIGAVGPNRYFGGCASTTAGAVCVPDVVDINHQSNIVHQDSRLVSLLDFVRLNAFRETPGIAVGVVIDDKIYIAARGKRQKTDTTDTVQETDRWQLNSVAKVISGSVAARAVDQGTLSWDSTLGATIPSVFPAPFPDYANVTLAQLNAHASGFDYSTTPSWTCLWTGNKPGCQPNPPPDAANDYDGYPATERKRLLTRDYTRDYPLFPPGAGWIYGTGAVPAISMVEQKLFSIRYDDLMSDLLFRAIGIKRGDAQPLWTSPDVSGHWYTVDPMTFVIDEFGPVAPEQTANKARVPVGGVGMSIEDLSRFAQAVLYSPRAPWRPWSYQTHQAQVNNVGQSAWSASGWAVSVNNSAGGLQLWHNGCEGVNYSWIFVWPQRRIALAGLTNTAQGCSARGLDWVYQELVDNPQTGGAIGRLASDFGVPPPVFPYQNAPSFLAGALSSTNKPNDEPWRATDGDYNSYWAAQDSDTSGAWLKVNVAQQPFIGHVLVNENGTFPKMGFDPDLGLAPRLGRGGDGIAEFRVRSWQLYLIDSSDTEWLAATGTTLGANKLIPVNGYNVKGAKLVMNTEFVGPVIKEMHLLPW
jgi:CubicO group peptidase (beta-lactamase class C family)